MLLAVIMLMIQSVVLSDILTPYSEEERGKLDSLLTKQLASNQDEDIFGMANAFIVLNSSTMINNRSYLCQVAVKKIRFDAPRCSEGLNAAAVLGCELSFVNHANLSKLIAVHVKMLDEKKLKSIHCASETILLLKAAFDKNAAASVDVNVIAKRIVSMLRSDHTFAEEGTETAAAIKTGYAIKSLANLALLDPDRFSPRIVHAVMERREEILLQLADAAIDDPSIHPLSLALQVCPLSSASRQLPPRDAHACFGPCISAQHAIRPPRAHVTAQEPPIPPTQGSAFSTAPPPPESPPESPEIGPRGRRGGAAGGGAVWCVCVRVCVPVRALAHVCVPVRVCVCV
jgi:hypothetical protein